MMRRVARSATALLLAGCASSAPLTPTPGFTSRAEVRTPSSRAAPLKTPSSAPIPAEADPVAEIEERVAAPPAPPAVIGDPVPLELLSASSSGAWVAWCDKATKSARLALGTRPPLPVDELLASDPMGRYVVVSRGGGAWLEDARGGDAVDLSALGADVRRVRADYAEHRSLSFDSRGRYLAYLTKRGPETRVIVRTLEDGSERSVSPGAGEVFRLELSADARYVTLDVLREDTNRSGKLEWPAPLQAPENPCERANLPRFRSFAYQSRGDAPSRAVLSVESGTLREVPGLVTPLGADLLLRDPDGSLQLDAAGKRTQLASPSCGGRVLFADAERQLVLATCTPPLPKERRGSLPLSVPKGSPGGKRQVWLFGKGVAKNLESELYETAVDGSAVVGARLVPLYPGSDSALFDLERRELLPLVAGSRVLATDGPRALLWRGNELFRYDALTRSEHTLGSGVHKNPTLLRAGTAVLLSPFVVVACDEAFPSAQPALALSANGFVLTTSVAPEGAPSTLPRGAIRGPLRWVDARLPPPDGPPR